MRAFHGTSAINAMSIINEGFSLDFLVAGSLGKGIYLSRDVNKCVDYGRHIIEVEIDEESILRDDFSSISSYSKTETDNNSEFMSAFRKYTLSKGYKGLELNTFNEIAIYDLSCILSVKPYTVK